MNIRHGDYLSENKPEQLLERLQKRVKQERDAVGYPERTLKMTYTEQVSQLVFLLLKTGMAANHIYKATGLSLSFVLNTGQRYKAKQSEICARELAISPSIEHTPSSLNISQVTADRPSTVTITLPNQIQLLLSESLMNSDFLKMIFQLQPQREVV